MFVTLKNNSFFSSISKAKSTHFNCGTDGNGLIHRFKRISTESFISFFSSHNSRPYLPYEPSQPDRGASVLIYISMCSSFLSASASRAFYEDFHFLKKNGGLFPSFLLKFSTVWRHTFAKIGPPQHL
jgi:hypothetical protein